MAHFNAFTSIAIVPNLVPWWVVVGVVVLLVLRMDLPEEEKMPHLESGLNQRERAKSTASYINARV